MSDDERPLIPRPLNAPHPQPFSPRSGEKGAARSPLSCLRRERGLGVRASVGAVGVRANAGASIAGDCRQIAGDRVRYRFTAIRCTAWWQHRRPARSWGSSGRARDRRWRAIPRRDHLGRRRVAEPGRGRRRAGAGGRRGLAGGHGHRPDGRTGAGSRGRHRSGNDRLLGGCGGIRGASASDLTAHAKANRQHPLDTGPMYVYCVRTVSPEEPRATGHDSPGTTTADDAAGFRPGPGRQPGGSVEAYA